MSPRMLVVGAGLVIASVLGLNLVSQSQAVAADCDNNAVIKCGYSTPSELASKTATSGELQAIYNHAYLSGYGMGSTSNFAANAKHFTTYKDGRVVLDDGTVIATGAASLGRQTNNGNNYSVMIGDTKYYWGYNSTAFASDGLQGYALINPDDHSMQFAALTSCGNPLWGKSPGYKCQMLNQTKVSDTTYSYSVVPYTSNGASVQKIVLDFGDGQSQEVSANQSVNHTYVAGDYTAKATVYFSVNGQTKSDTRAECTKPVHIPQPPKKVFTCNSLTAIAINGSRTQFTFTAKGSGSNTILQSGNFTFGDGQTANGIKASDTTTVTTPHTYATPGTYTATVTLTYDAGTTLVSQNCTVKVTVTPPTCAETPNAPECQTCQNTPTLPQCQPTPPTPPTPPQTPPQLPSTGPTEIIGGTMGLSTIAGATMYYHRTRRNWIDQIFKR